MTTEQLIHYNYRLSDVKQRESHEDTAIGWLRYQAIRRLTPAQFKDITLRSLKGECFDDIVDGLAADIVR